MYGATQQAYDRAITVFSPDGRLFQVEYAKEAVKRGATSIGVVGKDSVVLAAVKHDYSKLVVNESVRKIFEIDDHVNTVAAGLIADARKIVDMARNHADKHRVLYDESIPVKNIVKYVADTVQIYTQYGGARPFGVSLLIAGYDDKPKLYEIEPSGALTGYLADSIGENKKDVDAYLEKNYKEEMSLDETLSLAVSAIRKGMTKNANYSIEASYMKKGMKSFKRVEEKELEKY
ncbi:MAG: archaeal proteasome endopeptidase complex subunit alpha [Methanobacteriota archaeon]|nr:MAG: archaeal proteasome endopeptidase complex subunit alpha [Euryarchaeota archaeon]